MNEELLRQLVEAQFRSTYRGRKIVKNPFDFMVCAMLLTEYQPDLIIEIGTHEGGSALFFKDLCPYAEVHSIDLELSHRLVPGCRRFTGGWQNYDLATAFGGKVVVIDDGSHVYEDVLGAFRKFSPLVPVGGYYIVEDGIVDALGESASFNGGPLRAIREFLPGSGFEVCPKWQNFFPMTFNPEGYIQRVR